MALSIGIIFDWDGVIIDSASHHKASWENLAREENRVLPEGHFERGFGMKNDRILKEVLSWTSDPVEIHRLSERKEELYRESLKEKGIDPLPGVTPFLQSLAQNQIPCAIASSTHRANIDLALGLLKLRDSFQDIVSAEDVKLGKPHPEVFLAAARKLNRKPSVCVVFEDALVGIEAAHAAQMKVIGVATTHPASELTRAHRVVKRLDEITIADLEKLLYRDAS